MTVEASVTARQDQIVLTDSTPKPRIRFAEPDKIWPECSGSTDELDAPDLDRVDKVTIWLESFGQHSRFEDPELANSACTHSGSDSQLLAYRSTGDEKYRPPPPLKGILRDRRALTSQDQLCHLITTQIVAPATAAVDYLISLIYW
ncbi:uncharacterized protein L969DRAFT_92618 [Mixia osmundae IAM 14324]|uniref:Uncharacterized protein n=1 Tax=Mixia osmundae (strain CBS 9802 / IAM 14324 / JCM 22182 / KY 12970) TaxID=764103 RepID=G7DY26_MIXOS|nr:uncharacterized protein L969DRAFT_92618 [Mixia osmundae IAM 14324]KEI41388.1 hypothetical protein L969DRAFT_92618 [Mixia osmundae IAM 14324]GAA95486.1 hypothetical protein E5Q_02141 [Mixia osmundae IAM 14324]